MATTYLTDYDDVRASLNVNDTQLPDANIRSPLAAAAVHLKKWITADVYDAVLTDIDAARAALTGNETLEEDGVFDTEADKTGAFALREAERNLCLMRLVPQLNRIVSDPGIKISVITDHGQTNSLRPDQEKTLQKEYKKAASEAVQPYSATAFTPVRVSRALDDAGNEIT